MKSIKLNKKVGADGILHLDVPVEIKDTEVEVMVIYQPLQPPSQSKAFNSDSELKQSLPTRTTRRGRIFPEIQWTEEQFAAWEAEGEEFYQHCKPIFDKVKAELIETHYNWFVAVEPDSGAYFIDKNIEVVSLQCREKHPGKIHHTFRINETGACGTIQQIAG